MASGFIAGGALAGIIIAIMEGVFDKTDARLMEWATNNNPFFEGAWSDRLALIPFVALVILLYLTGRELILAPKKPQEEWK
jgi:hypothetical protein